MFLTAHARAGGSKTYDDPQLARVKRIFFVIACVENARTTLALGDVMLSCVGIANSSSLIAHKPIPSCWSPFEGWFENVVFDYIN